MELSNYIKIFPYDEKPGYLLCYSTKKSSTALIPEPVLDSIRDSLETSDAETLMGLGLLVHDRDKEKKEMLHIIDDMNKRKKELNAIVVLNLDCNLRCKYCFEGSMKGKHYMLSDTADMLIDFIEDRYIADGKKVHLDFYGGEPLLGTGLVKYISKSLKTSAEKNGSEYTFGLVTNGTLLTVERAEDLMIFGLKDAKVTLDGHRENHDNYRMFRSGAGSFDIIIKNIRDVCGIIGIQVGGNYTADNYKDFPLLLDYLLEQGITPDKVVNVKFDPVTKTRKELALTDFTEGAESVNEPWVFEASIFLREEILKRGYYTPKITPSPCMVEITDDIVVNHDGTLYKCPAFIGRQGLEAGTLIAGLTDHGGPHKPDIWKNQECLDCAYLPLCFGGCRFMRLVRDGEINGVDCQKTYLDATLETFVRQEIKYNLKAENH